MKVKGQRLRWLESISDSVDMSLSKLQETVTGREAWRAAVHGGDPYRDGKVRLPLGPRTPLLQMLI